MVRDHLSVLRILLMSAFSSQLRSLSNKRQGPEIWAKRSQGQEDDTCSGQIVQQQLVRTLFS
jgi:hypothetical protein